MRQLMDELDAKHPSVGATRSIGLFGVIELVRNRETREPMAPFGGTSPEMAALGKFFREHGLFTFVRWNYFFTNPPLSITEDELREGFAIIDRGPRSHGRSSQLAADVKPGAAALRPYAPVSRECWAGRSASRGADARNPRLTD